MNEHHFEEPIYPPLTWELPQRRPPGLPERERFPVSRERRQRSSAALHALRQEHPDRVEGHSFPWRARLLAATGLPATLRTWGATPFDKWDDETAERQAREVVAVDRQSEALFGEIIADRFEEEFATTPVIKVRTNSEQGDGSVMRHFGWRQEYGGLPVLGGSVRVHEVTGERRLCVTSSYFPVADAPPDLNPSVSEVNCKWIALLSLFETGAFDPEVALAIMLRRFFEERRNTEAADFLRFLELEQSRLNGSELWFRAHEDLAQFHELGEGIDIAAEVLDRIRALFEKRYGEVRCAVEVARVHDRELAIVPWAGAYVLTQRIQVTLDDGFPWYVDVDGHTGEVLGAPWQAVVQELRYVTTSAEAAADQANGDAASVDTTDLAAYVTMRDGNTAVPLGAAGALPATLSIDAATVVVHGQRMLQHLQQKCGAGLSAPPSRLTVHARSPQPDIELAGFSPNNSGAVHFRGTPAAGISVGGKTVFHPARDPEVVMHEFAHAFLWLLNPNPWDVLTGPAPFSRALQEGYAMYLARSLADQDGDNQDQHWGRGAYRPRNANSTTNWGDRWQLNRSASVVGADLLPVPNVYPAGEYTLDVTLEDYDTGMVWARALWDLRTVLGPEAADKLAVRAYPYLHGYLTSFELAAEAFINADAQVSELDLANGTQPVWAGRGIAAGQGIYGFAQAQSGTMIAASDAGILRSADGGATWTLENANLAGGGTLTGVVAVAADDDHLYAIAELPPPTASGSDPHWNPGVYWRDLGQAGSLWQEVPGWPGDITPLCLLRVGAGQMLVGSNRGVYALTRQAVNNHILTPPQNTASAQFPALHLVAFVENNVLRVQAAAPNRLHESVLSDGVLDPIWAPSNNLFNGGHKTRIAAFVAQGTRLVAGVIPPAAVPALPTLWELDPAWNAPTAIGNLVAAPLALAANGNRLWVATATNVLEQVGNGALSGLGLPVKGAQVLSLAVAGGHLLAGTLAHGIWRRPIAGGAWQPAYEPPQPATVTVPAAGDALFSFLLGAAHSAFTIELPPASPVQVTAVYQVGFPPGPVAAAPGNRYNLQAGAVVVALHNSDNAPRTVQFDRSNPDRLGLI